MRWKKKPNLIVALVLSLAYAIVTLLNIIGPLHMNNTEKINPLSNLVTFSLIYFIVALWITWGLYFCLKKKAELLFFTLIIVGMLIIIFENFLWGWWGS